MDADAEQSVAKGRGWDTLTPDGSFHLIRSSSTADQSTSVESEVSLKHPIHCPEKQGLLDRRF